MNKSPFALAFLALGAPLHGAEPTTPSSKLDEVLPGMIRDGKFILDVRVRYEHADQIGQRPSHAFTERIRLGYETGDYLGFKVGADFEDIRQIGSDNNANLAGTTRQPLRRVVPDPAGTELNQAWLSFSKWNTTLKGGRQRIKLDDDRFIGNVGWRQNEQTFDAVGIRNTSIENLDLYYAYIGHVNRIFGDSHPLGDWNSDSHIVHASYKFNDLFKLTGYYYSLDFSNAAASSSVTWGGFLEGSHAFNDDWKANYHAEIAYQEDGAGNPASYAEIYQRYIAGLNYKRVGFGLGLESLGGNGAGSFQFPLSTAHAFNGWADHFLTTPANGLEDYYAYLTVKLPYDMPFQARFHHFKSEFGNTEFGNEIDFQVTKKFGKGFMALGKLAQYFGDGPFASRLNVWFEINYTF